MNDLIVENNYIHIPNFISPERAKELSKGFIEYCSSHEVPGDSQIPESHATYNYVDFLELLCEKTPEVSRFLGETVLPTYVYARVYKKGATLERHRDREACEISLTLHLSSNSEWPIYIQRPDGEEVSVDLSPGDVMMYRGNIADHWRERFEGTEYVQVFLHYVRSRGPNNWAFFDKTRTKPEVPVILMNEVTPEKKPEVKLTEPTKKYSKSLEDYIQVFEDIVPDSLCADILKEYGADADWSPTHVGQGVIDTGIRNVDSIAISRADVIGDSLERQRIDHELFKCAGEAIRRYNQVFPEAQIEQDSGYELLRYKTGQFYVQHTDSFKAQPRAVSCSFALNDNFSGGEWGFWDKDKIIKAKKGSAVMFPSNFMYPHEILPTTSGTRYSIITWFI